MPTFVEITPDPFAEQFRKETAGDSLEDGSRPGSTRVLRKSFAHVRRPVRGIQIKEDTYATLQVRTADGRVIPLVDAGGVLEDTNNPGIAYSEKYSNFLLQSMQEERSEKTQVVQTFGAPFIFFFGEHPRVIQGSGVLLNTEDFNWRAEFWENYENYLRGSKCLQNKTRITLSWDDVVVEGYFIQAGAQESSQEPNQVNFSFQIFLTNYQNVSAIGSSDFPSGSFEGNVNPDLLEIPGIATLPSASDTALVRQLNVQEPDYLTKNSLYQALRDGVSEVVGYGGQVEALFNLTNNLLSSGNGRVRVPVGFAGGSVFDAETQIALASVDPLAQNIVIRSTLSGQDFYITGTRGKKTMPVTFGKFKDSVDEYIAKTPKSGNEPNKPIDLFSGQKANYQDIEGRIKDVFNRYGVSVDPPVSAIKLAKELTFGSVQVGVETETDLSPLRNVLQSALI